MLKKTSVKTWRLTSKEAERLKALATQEGVTESDLIHLLVFNESSLLYHYKQLKDMINKKEVKKNAYQKGFL